MARGGKGGRGGGNWKEKYPHVAMGDLGAGLGLGVFYSANLILQRAVHEEGGCGTGLQGFLCYLGGFGGWGTIPFYGT